MNLEADALFWIQVDELYKDEEYENAINLLTKNEIIEFKSEINNENREILDDILVDNQEGRMNVWRG